MEELAFRELDATPSRRQPTRTRPRMPRQLRPTLPLPGVRVRFGLGLSDRLQSLQGFYSSTKWIGVSYHVVMQGPTSACHC